MYGGVQKTQLRMLICIAFAGSQAQLVQAGKDQRLPITMIEVLSEAMLRMSADPPGMQVKETLSRLKMNRSDPHWGPILRFRLHLSKFFSPQLCQTTVPQTSLRIISSIRRNSRGGVDRTALLDRAACSLVACDTDFGGRTRFYYVWRRRTVCRDSGWIWY